MKKLKIQHSDAFYMKQYNKYQSNIKKANAFPNFDTFKSEYIAAEKEGMTNIRKNFEYETDNEINYDVYVAERDALKSIGIKAKKSDLLNMSTTEFADKYSDEIMDAYNMMKGTGAKGKEVGEFISSYFFGSM